MQNHERVGRYRAIAAAAVMLVGMVGMVGGGAGLGYWAGVERMRGMLAEDREDHLGEIARLQEANRIALQALTGRVAHAADRSAEAADTASAAAETAQAAAATAGKVAKAAGMPAAALEHDRRAINTTINRANARIAGEAAK